jgi:hypothetical protein
MSPSRSIVVVALLALLAAATAVVRGQSTSPLSGTWKLNLAKSTYNPATLAPKSATIKYTVTGDQIEAISDGVDSKGRVTHTEYTAKLDGSTATGKFLIDGKPNPDQDGVSWKKIDNNTFETTTMLKGKALVTSHIVVAADGKSRTSTGTGTNAQGQKVNNKVSYDKQ